MIAEATLHLPGESGGIMIGRIAGDELIVTLAGDSGANAWHAPTRFRRDGEHAQRLLERAFAESNGRDDYVGEWHSHPLDADASPTDRNSMRAISRDPDFAVSAPLLIVLRRSAGSWRPFGHQVHGVRLHPLTVQYDDSGAYAAEETCSGA